MPLTFYSCTYNTHPFLAPLVSSWQIFIHSSKFSSGVISRTRPLTAAFIVIRLLFSYPMPLIPVLSTRCFNCLLTGLSLSLAHESLSCCVQFSVSIAEQQWVNESWELTVSQSSPSHCGTTVTFRQHFLLVSWVRCPVTASIHKDTGLALGLTERICSVYNEKLEDNCHNLPETSKPALVNYRGRSQLQGELQVNSINE